MRFGLTHHHNAVSGPGSTRFRGQRHSLRSDHGSDAHAGSRRRRCQDRMAYDRLRAPTAVNSQPRGNGGSTPMGARGPRRQQLRPTRRRMGSWLSIPYRRMLAPTCSAHYRLSGRMARSRAQSNASAATQTPATVIRPAIRSDNCGPPDVSKRWCTIAHRRPAG